MLRIERGGVEKEVQLNAAHLPAPQSLREQRWRDIAVFLPRGLAFLIVAILIGLLKPQNQQARLTTLAFLANVALSLENVVIRLNRNAQFNLVENQIAFVFMLVMGTIWFAPLGYHVCYEFPSRVPAGRFWSFLKWLLYSVGAILYVNFLVVSITAYTSQALTFLSSYHAVNISMVWLNFWYWLVGILAISAVLIRNNIKAKEPDQRRRSRLVLYATLL